MNILLKRTACITLLILGTLLSGCRTKVAESKPWQMGEKVQIGPFIYTVVEADWKTELHGSNGNIYPKNRFLVLRISVTNSGGVERNLQFLHIKNDKDDQIIEYSELEGLAGWLGVIRKLAASATDQGIIVFDVPLGNYKLIVSDGGNADEERTSLIDIPLVMKPESVSGDAPITGR